MVGQRPSSGASYSPKKCKGEGEFPQAGKVFALKDLPVPFRDPRYGQDSVCWYTQRPIRVVPNERVPIPNYTSEVSRTRLPVIFLLKIRLGYFGIKVSYPAEVIISRGSPAVRI